MLLIIRTPDGILDSTHSIDAGWPRKGEMVLCILQQRNSLTEHQGRSPVMVGQTLQQDQWGNWEIELVVTHVLHDPRNNTVSITVDYPEI